jgi:hypothetical protein
MYCGYACKSKNTLALHKALLFLGDVFISSKYYETAANLYMVALEGFTRMDVHHSRAKCIIRLGDLANKKGSISEEIGFWTAARPLFEQSLQARDIAQIDVRLSTVETVHQKALLEPVPDESVNKDVSGAEKVEAVTRQNHNASALVAM